MLTMNFNEVLAELRGKIRTYNLVVCINPRRTALR